MTVPAKPILRVGKLKMTGRSTPQSVDAHLSRSRPTHNADPARTPQNRWLVGGPGELNDTIDVTLAKAKLSRAGLRRDATIANDVLLTVSPQWFRPDAPDAAGTWDAKRLRTFEREAAAFLREQFGARCIAAVLHLDEATPHIQAVVVPLHRKPEGGFRLSGKDLFNPERLRALQGAWEARLKPHGVGPRTQNSPARHQTIRTYYSALQEAPRLPKLVPSPPPPPKLLEGASARQKRLADWQEGEARKAAKRIQPLAAAAAKGALLEAEQRANIALRSNLHLEAAATDRLQREVAQLREQRALDKAEVARLRGVPVNQVALALGFTGEIGRKENPIDLVKRVGGLDYQGAVTWLAHAFGADVAAASAAQEVRAAVAGAPPVFTKAEQVKARAITRQLDALAAPAYRVTVMKELGGKKVGQNLGKDSAGGPEQLWSRDDIIGMLPRLTAENARGGNVYVTPIDPAAHHVLIDDLKAADLARLRADGYQPAVVLESSPGNHQAVVKVGRDVPEAAANEWFKALNRELGDERITGLRHPFRLAGFQNRKPKYEAAGQYPFVTVVEAANRLCQRARVVVLHMAQQMHLAPPTPAESARPRGPR